MSRRAEAFEANHQEPPPYKNLYPTIRGDEEAVPTPSAPTTPLVDTTMYGYNVAYAEVRYDAYVRQAARAAAATPNSSHSDDDGSGSGSGSGDFSAAYGLEIDHTRATAAKLTRASVEGMGRVGALPRRSASSDQQPEDDAPSPPPATFGDPYALAAEIRGEPAPAPNPPGMLGWVQPKRRAKAAGAAVAGAASTAAHPRRALSRSVLAVRLWGADRGDPATVVPTLVRTAVPLVEWEREGAPLHAPQTWVALDDLSFELQQQQQQQQQLLLQKRRGAEGRTTTLLKALSRCEGWNVHTLRRDPRHHGKVWGTLLAWGFTGADADVTSPWFDVVLLGSEGVGLKALHVDAALNLKDVTTNILPVGTLAQLAAVDEMPSPIPFLCRFMGFTGEDLASLPCSQLEAATLLGLTRKIARRYHLLDGERTRARLWQERGWCPELLEDSMGYARKEAQRLFPWSERAPARSLAPRSVGGGGGHVRLLGGSDDEKRNTVLLVFPGQNDQLVRGGWW